MTSPTTAPRTCEPVGASGLHQASDGRWQLQTFLSPSQILSSIENSRPVSGANHIRLYHHQFRLIGVDAGRVGRPPSGPRS